MVANLAVIDSNVPHDALPIDTQIGGYSIEKVLGQGGFGITYQAFNAVTGHRVAIKEFFPKGYARRGAGLGVTFLQSDQALIDWAVKKFKETTTALCGLTHPNIVKVLNYVPANDTGYMIMELLEGRTLSDWLAARPGRPTLEDMRGVVDPIMAALSYVHGEGLIHRDVAPDNILVTTDGRPVLIDFGSVSKDLSTRAGASTGTTYKVHYTAPEQTGTRSNPDPLVDVYSLGAVLYRAFAGEPPEDSRDRLEATVTQGRADPLKPLAAFQPAGCPPKAIAAIDASLSLERSKRPQSVEALRIALRPEAPVVAPSKKKLVLAAGLTALLATAATYAVTKYISDRYMDEMSVEMTGLKNDRDAKQAAVTSASKERDDARAALQQKDEALKAAVANSQGAVKGAQQERDAAVQKAQQDKDAARRDFEAKERTLSLRLEQAEKASKDAQAGQDAVVAQLRRDVAAATNGADEARRSLAEKSLALDQANADAAELSNRLQSRDAAARRAEQDLTSARIQITNLKNSQAAQSQSEEVKQLQSDIERQASELNAAIAARDSAQRDLGAKQTELQGLRADLDRKTSDYDAAIQSKGSTQQDLSARLQSALIAKQSSDRQVVAKIEEMRSLNGQISDLRNELSAKTSELDSAVSESSSVQQQLANANADISRLRQQLDAARKVTTSGSNTGSSIVIAPPPPAGLTRIDSTAGWSTRYDSGKLDLDNSDAYSADRVAYSTGWFGKGGREANYFIEARENARCESAAEYVRKRMLESRASIIDQGAGKRVPGYDTYFLKAYGKDGRYAYDLVAVQQNGGTVINIGGKYPAGQAGTYQGRLDDLLNNFRYPTTSVFSKRCN